MRCMLPGIGKAGRRTGDSLLAGTLVALLTAATCAGLPRLDRPFRIACAMRCCQAGRPRARCRMQADCGEMSRAAALELAPVVRGLLPAGQGHPPALAAVAFSPAGSARLRQLVLPPPTPPPIPFA